MFEGQNQIRAETVSSFFSDGEIVHAAVARLEEAGFEILQISPLTINIAGTVSQYRQAFGTNIVVQDRPVIKEGARKDVAQFLDSPDTSLSGLIQTQGTNFEDTVEGVALEEPRYYMAGPSMFAPLKSYWHLRLPGDVSLGCNADKAHRTGITGKGIKVAMCDSGWFKHPYFIGRGYKAAPVVLGPAATLPLKDESGHGTGESANIFANAPDIDFMPVKMNFVNSTGAFNAAGRPGPAYHHLQLGQQQHQRATERGGSSAGRRDRGSRGLRDHRGLFSRQRPRRLPRSAPGCDLRRRCVHEPRRDAPGFELCERLSQPDLSGP